MTARLIRAGDAASQFFNVVIFNGDPNYSISGDAYRLKRERLRRAIDWLFSPFEADHCRRAHLHDVVKAHRLLSETSPDVLADAMAMFGGTAQEAA